MTKHLVFNYKRYVELRDAYKQLLADNQKLAADNRKLREKLTNLEIKCRYFELAPGPAGHGRADMSLLGG